jgi:hypothetical protein
MTRGLTAIAVAMAVLIAAPAVAAAAERYAAPDGSGAVCSDALPCAIHEAINNAAANDEVIILAGDYGSATAPLSGSVASPMPNLNVHGEDGQPRPRIFLDTGNNSTGFGLTGVNTEARHFEVHHHASSGSRQAAFLLNDAEATDIVARIVSPQGKACVVLGTSLLTNSVCEATATSAFGIATHTGVGPGADNSSVLRNVTAIAQGSGSIGIHAYGGNFPGEDQSLTVTNAIARGGPGQADVAANRPCPNPGDPCGNAVVTIDHSNFGFEGALPPGSGDRVVDGPGGGNQRFVPVNFAGPGDFHQAAGSPTIDKGVTNVFTGPTDFDGDPRALGPGGTDIGADEFVPPPTAVTGDASAVTAFTATLNGTVNPNTVASSYHFEWGPTAAYGSSSPEIDVGAGSAEVGTAWALEGLSPSTTYHFRIVATNRGGTVAGADATYTTRPASEGGGALLSLGLVPKTFAAAARGGSAEPAQRRRRRPVGTTVTFHLSVPAEALFKVERRLPGKRVRGRCVKPRPRNRRARKCTRFVPRKGAFNVTGVPGENKFRFTGRLRGRKLPPGRYRLVGIAAGSRKTASFRIVRR